ncbi:hypothetical protein Landi51_08106 [Colletotrichum acutatum]
MNSSLPAAANKRFLPFNRAPYLPVCRKADGISPEMNTFQYNYFAYAKVGFPRKTNGPAALGAKKKEKLVNKGLPLFEVSAGVLDAGHSAARCREPGLDLSTQSDVGPAKV